MLEVNIQGTIIVVLQTRSAIPDRSTIDGIGHQIELGWLVHCKGPERITRGQFLQMQHLLIFTHQPVAIPVQICNRVDGFVSVVAPQANPGRQRKDEEKLGAILNLPP